MFTKNAQHNTQNTIKNFPWLEGTQNFTGLTLEDDKLHAMGA